MFQILSSLDDYLLRQINGTWHLPALDVFFRFVSNFDKLRMYLAVPIIALLIFCGNRWRYVFLLAVLALAATDLSATALKELVHRPRAYQAENIRLAENYRYSSKSSGFPSNHAANTFAPLLVIAWHLRKRKWAVALCLLPPLLVGYSRIYLGVHYPSDVAGGYLVGGAMAASVLLLNAYAPVVRFDAGAERAFSWRGLTLLFFFIAYVYRYSIVAHTDFPLAPEETQYWDWSRRLDWCYYSNPPLIAILLRISTSTFGHTQFAVRSVAVTMSLGMMLFGGLLAQRIFKSDRTTFFVLIGLFFTPIFAGNAIITTADAPLMCFWAACCYYLYITMVERQDWAWWPAGLCVALGFLSKYAMLYIFVCMAAYYFLPGADRSSLRAKGLLIFTGFTLLSFIPVIIWNMQHGWVGFEHLAVQAKVQEGFKIEMLSLLRYIGEQALVASPVFFLVWLAASISILFFERNNASTFDRFFLSMGLTVYFILLVKSIQGQVLANWAMPAYFTLTMLAVTRLERHFQRAASPGGRRAYAALGIAGIAPALVAFPNLHEPSIFDHVVKVANLSPRPGTHPAYQVMGFDEMGKWVTNARDEMPNPGKVFLFAQQYQEAAEMAFYVQGNPQTYTVDIGKKRASQYSIWNGLDASKKGYDAIYVVPGHVRRIEPEISGSFKSVSEPVYLSIIHNNQEFRQFTLFKCFGFSGEFENARKFEEIKKH